jgi:alpha-L-fucosidase 2
VTERSHISSSSSADTWDHGVVAGTGVAGAVVYGRPARHRIVFSHERFLLPANSRRAAPDLAAVLPELRAALAEGDSSSAADLIEQRMRELGLDPSELVWTDPLVPIGEIVWEPDDGEPAEGYRRRIPLRSGGVTVSWARAGTARSLSVIAERGRSEFIVEVSSDGPLTGRLSVGAVHETRVGASNVGADDYSRFVRTALEHDGHTRRLRITAPGREDADTVQALLAVAPLDDAVMTGGEPGSDFDGWRVELPRGGTARLRVSVSVTGGTDHGGADDGEFDEMLARSALDLQGESIEATVEELWSRARHGDPHAERAVFEVAYAAGRRNIIASTGVLPPTLQGVWAGTWAPAWSADYTLNGNVQNGTLADVLWTGAPELLRSLFRLVTPFREHFRSNARNIFGLDGMLLPARMTTHGHANHFTRDFPHQYWVGNGPWLTRLLADYVLVTGDAAAVDEAMWEIVREVLAFSLGLLADAGGHLSPSFSPENTPAGSAAPLATDATMDLGAIRDGLRAGAFLADLRGEPDIGAAWREDAQRVGGFEVASDGTLSEWSGRWAEQLEHRHTSQLYPLWYVSDPAFEDAALREAALTTVRAKIAWRAEDPTPPPGRMEMAFGLAQLGLAAAALGDADAAYQCALWLARDHFRPSLVSTHDAGEIFNLDASGALPAVVTAMLLGSAPGELRLFPALPTQWPTGRITGLTARGGWIVDELDWSLERIRLRAHARPGTAWLRTTGTVIRAMAQERHGPRVIASIPADQETIALDLAWPAQTESR